MGIVTVRFVRCKSWLVLSRLKENEVVCTREQNTVKVFNSNSSTVGCWYKEPCGWSLYAAFVGRWVIVSGWLQCKWMEGYLLRWWSYWWRTEGRLILRRLGWMWINGQGFREGIVDRSRAASNKTTSPYAYWTSIPWLVWFSVRSTEQGRFLAVTESAASFCFIESILCVWRKEREELWLQEILDSREMMARKILLRSDNLFTYLFIHVFCC